VKRLAFEALEARQLLASADIVNGVLIVQGDAGNNNIVISVALDFEENPPTPYVSVKNNGIELLSIGTPPTAVRGINVTTGDGDDIVDLEGVKASGGWNLVPGPTETAPRVNVSTGNDVDTVYGSEFADYIDVGDMADYAFGDQGDDIIFGGGNTDVLKGEGGNDEVHGEEGFDLLYGGSGDD
jgi:Ca2+-binding RTX toxin-like protein